jgi:hypothetical protein
MGKVPPMGANVAYSLYGSLKGQKFSGCNENTFINSFYTNTGFQDFAQAMYYAGQSGFSSYAYDDDSSGGLAAGCGGGYGVGCDATYGFALHTYSTDTCDPAWVNGVKDPLYDLNSAFEASTCVKIYDSSSYSGYSSGTALQLLDYSSACFYQNFYSPDGECPDPYGKIKYYRQNFANGLSREKRAQPYQIYTHEVKKGQILVAVGSLLVLVASIMLCTESRKTRKLQTKDLHAYEDGGMDGPDGLVRSTGDDSSQPSVTFTPPPPATAYQAPPPPPPVPVPPVMPTAPPEPTAPTMMYHQPMPPAQPSVPPPQPPVAATGFQQIHPSPLASRDESVVSSSTYHSPDATPYQTGANLSLLAGALGSTSSPAPPSHVDTAAPVPPPVGAAVSEEIVFGTVPSTTTSMDYTGNEDPVEDSAFLMEEAAGDDIVPQLSAGGTSKAEEEEEEEEEDSEFLTEQADGHISMTASKESSVVAMEEGGDEAITSSVSKESATSKDSTPVLMDALMGSTSRDEEGSVVATEPAGDEEIIATVASKESATSKDSTPVLMDVLMGSTSRDEEGSAVATEPADNEEIIATVASKESTAAASTENDAEGPTLVDAATGTEDMGDIAPDASKDTVDSSVKLDQMLSDKIDAALSSSKDDQEGA